MTASIDDLGDIHRRAAAILRELLEVREEPVLSNGEVVINAKTGEPYTRKVFPTAAELAQVNAFLKNNNITASPATNDALSELEAMMAERRAKRARPVAPALPDPYDDLPKGFGGLQ